MERNTTTYEKDGPVISILIWLELDRNLSKAYIEKRPLNDQLSSGVDLNIAV